jgi:hypothetical protein
LLLFVALHHPQRVLCADMVDQINVHEYPALANLRARNLTMASLSPQSDGMEAKQFSGGVQVKGFHAEPPAMIWGRKSA